MNQQPTILEAHEAAKMLKMHLVTLRAKASSGEIPGRKAGRKWLFIDVDLIAYIRSEYESDKTEREDVCQSTSVKTRRIGGLKSPKAVNEQYIKALEPKTAIKHKNSTTN